MKKTWKYLAWAALVCGLSLTVTSCKDDDDDKKTEEQKAEEAKQAEDIFWDVVGQLTSVDNYTADYKDQTFEPSIGQPSASNPNVRIVSTGDMATAAQRFANLVGVSSINESTPSYEWKNDAVGTLTYTKTNSGSSLATVDVNIKQMPHLQQIIYCTPEQMGTNGSFTGNAYYRFGDVIKREYTDTKSNSQLTEYWVCVRPAVGAAGKETTHWITLSQLPTKNLFSYSSNTNGYSYSLPTGIGTNKEHMQNLAELVYAILYPHEWGKNLTSDDRTPHPKMWYDFKPERYKYNNEYFFERVQRHWKDPDLDIFGKVFGMNDIQFEQVINNYGLNLLVKGYSWWTSTSWNCTLYQYKYTNGTGAEANMHKETYTEIKKDVREDNNLNFKSQYAKGYNYLQSTKMFGDAGPRYAIRHATGKDLFGQTPDVYKTMAGTKNGVTITDVYLYNPRNNVNVGSGFFFDETPPYSKLDAPVVGCIIGKDGNFYSNMSSAKEYGSQGIAMVTYLGGDKRVEKGSDFNGLAIALEDVTINGNSVTRNSSWSGDNTPDVYCTTQVTSPQEYVNLLDGIANTKRLSQSTCGKGHEHTAATMTVNWKGDLLTTLPADRFSRWFIPSVGQWVLTLQGVGETQTGSNFTYTSKLSNLYKAAGLDGDDGGEFWTTSEYSYDKVLGVTIERIVNQKISITPVSKNPRRRVMPMLAFKYNGGGTQDPPAVNPSLTYPAVVGYVLTDDGKFFPNKAKADAANQEVIGIVVYVNEKGSVESSATEYTGLAIASEAFDKTSWCENNNMEDAYTTKTSNLADAVKILDGLKMTDHLTDLEVSDNMKFDAAHKCWNKTIILNQTTMHNFSKWFLPSVGQWALAFQGMGFSEDYIVANTGTSMTQSIKKLFTDAGLPALADGVYWTSTTHSNGKIWSWGSNINFKEFTGDWTDMKALPFIAFKQK